MFYLFLGNNSFGFVVEVLLIDVDCVLMLLVEVSFMLVFKKVVFEMECDV